MSKRVLLLAAVLLVAAAFAVQADKKAGDWTGWITDSHCGAQGAKAGHGECAKKCVKDQNAKFALYSPADKKVYQLDAQDKAAAHAGQHVKVSGSVDGDNIKVTSIEPTGEQKGQDKPKS